MKSPVRRATARIATTPVTKFLLGWALACVTFFLGFGGFLALCSLSDRLERRGRRNVARYCTIAGCVWLVAILAYFPEAFG